MAEPTKESEFTGSELARWLEEAGRRRVVRKPSAEPVAVAAPAPAAPRKAYITHPRELVLIFAVAAAYLPYFFADVYLQISSLPSVIVFV